MTRACPPLTPLPSPHSRVLEWIFKRCENPQSAPSKDTPIGAVPDVDNGGLNTTGLDGVSIETLRALTEVNPSTWMAEMARNEAYLKTSGDRVPKGIVEQHDAMVARLKAAGGVEAPKQQLK